jgi:hypothetical protein
VKPSRHFNLPGQRRYPPRTQPAVLGAQQSKRFDFAYEIASDILGCWTGG